MVDTDAVSVKRARIRIARPKLGHSCSHIIGSIWQRVSVEVRLQGRHRVLTRPCIRNASKSGLRQTEPEPLVRKEEESSISEQGTTERSSEIVLPLFSFLKRRDVC